MANQNTLSNVKRISDWMILEYQYEIATQKFHDQKYFSINSPLNLDLVNFTYQSENWYGTILLILIFMLMYVLYPSKGN